MKSIVMQPAFRLLLPLAYMAGIFLLSSIPDVGTPETMAESLLQWTTPELQNLLHVPLFGGLAAAWHWALHSVARSRRIMLLLAFLITTAYAFLDEWHQLHIPGRYGSWTDVMLNLIGIIAALWIMDTKNRGTGRTGMT